MIGMTLTVIPKPIGATIQLFTTAISMHVIIMTAIVGIVGVLLGLLIVTDVAIDAIIGVMTNVRQEIITK